MLIKLIKYDIRADYKKYMITAAVILLLSLAVRLADIKFGNLDNGSDWKLLFEFLAVALILLCGVALLMTLIISAVRYQKKMYSDEGYLMNTLPIHPVLHILSSILTTCIWTVFIAAVDLLALIISAGGMAFWEGFFTPFVYMWNSDRVFAFNTFAYLILTPVTMMLTLIFTINFGYLFRSHRIVAGIGGYVGLCIISQILTAIIYFLLGKANVNAKISYIISENPNYFSSSESYQRVIVELAKLSEGSYLPSLIANIILFAALLIISVYILKKKINLD